MTMACGSAMAFFSLLLLQANAIPIKPELQPCSAGFFAYNGWCVSLSSADLTFDGAVNYCKSIDSFAPSIHSQSDNIFWANAVSDLKPANDHFWLDASCPSAGQVYQWRDGTPTDFFGPSN
ncbi:hypothetical protein PFISCL1PPCAC_28563, partial [Pristionchus fissidentatus]